MLNQKVKNCITQAALHLAETDYKEVDDIKFTCLQIKKSKNSEEILDYLKNSVSVNLKLYYVYQEMKENKFKIDRNNFIEDKGNGLITETREDLKQFGVSVDDVRESLAYTAEYIINKSDLVTKGAMYEGLAYAIAYLERFDTILKKGVK